jgi:hypothetical protein
MSDLFIAGSKSRRCRPLYLGLWLLLGILTGCGGGGGQQRSPIRSSPTPTPPPTFKPHYTSAFIFSTKFAQLAVNDTMAYTADAEYQTSPTESTTQDVTSQATWSTSDATVATVNDAGSVTGIGTGSATITASFDGVVGTALVIVNQKPTITVTVSSFVPDTLSLSFFGTNHPEFIATATYPDGSQLDATGFAAWTADPSGILKFGKDYTYQGGVATLIAVGKTTVTVKLKTGETGTLDVFVVP